MGLYIITDALKPSWVEKVYGEKNPTSLYKCESIYSFTPNNASNCVNEDKDITDNSEWVDFLTKISTAQSASDIENIFEIDHYLYELAIEYLLFGWDHSCHNFYFYRQPNGKWIYLTYDFDYDIGFSTGKVYDFGIDDYINKESSKHELSNLLILQDSNKFMKILKDVVDRVFNPSILYPHIDELKQFIKFYVELDKTPDANGFYPGVLNKYSNDFYSIEEWDAFSEFTSHYQSYGLKYWILLKYRSVCQKFNLDCDPIYMDENYKYPINENLNYEISHENDDFSFYYSVYQDYPFESFYSYPFEYPTENFIESPTESLIEIPTENFIEYPTENFIESPTENFIEIPTEITTEGPTESLTTTNSPTNDVNEYYSSSTFIEKETIYDVDEPTFNADDESSFDEDDTIESIVSTKTITKTKTIIYTTISN